MAKGLFIRLFRFLSFIGLTILPLNAFGESFETTIACKKMESLGLHHQCQEVRVLKNLRDRARLYQVVDQNVVTLDHENIFKILPMQSSDAIQAGQKVMVSSHFFWRTSPKEFKTICKVRASHARTVQVNCGSNKDLEIQKAYVFLPSLVKHPREEREKTTQTLARTSRGM